MRVRALLFASLRDIVGGRAVDVELGDPGTVADLSKWLGAHWPLLAARLEKVRVAVNDTFVDVDHPLREGDEVAYLPPVSGGRGTSVVTLTDGVISVDSVLSAVKRHDCGALVLFLGTVRDNFQGVAVVGMEYEAHRVLAEHALAAVVEEATTKWDVGAVAVTHRVGRLDLGDVSVAVAVAAPHRAAAFECGRFLIDRLKETVPIWKREILENGEVWIEGDERIPAARQTLLEGE